MSDSGVREVYVYEGMRLVPETRLLLWAEKLAATEARAKASDMALQSLTPGGSEFVNDPQACVRFVRDFRDGQHAQILKLTRERRAAEEKLRIVSDALLRTRKKRPDGSVVGTTWPLREAELDQFFAALKVADAALTPPPEAEKRGEG